MAFPIVIDGCTISYLRNVQFPGGVHEAVEFFPNDASIPNVLVKIGSAEIGTIVNNSTYPYFLGDDETQKKERVAGLVLIDLQYQLSLKFIRHSVKEDVENVLTCSLLFLKAHLWIEAALRKNGVSADDVAVFRRATDDLHKAEVSIPQFILLLGGIVGKRSNIRHVATVAVDCGLYSPEIVGMIQAAGVFEE